MASATMSIGIAAPLGMTAANGCLSAISALGFDSAEGLDRTIFDDDEPGATTRRLAPSVYHADAFIDAFKAFDGGALRRAAHAHAT